MVAAGDIGVGLEGGEWLAALNKPTIYVAGNHEYYGGDIAHTRHAIAEATAATEVHFLENESVEIAGTRFLGATLWTDYFGGDAQIMALASAQMNDYFQIRCNARLVSPDRLLDINNVSTQWLARELATPYDGNTVVVTHHAPSEKSWSAHNPPELCATYCNRLDDFFARFAIDLWIHGHIHAVLDYEIAATRVVCNPRGYSGYQLVDGFSANRTIEL